MAPGLLAAALRLPLAIAYPLLAHWASVAGSDPVAGVALVDLALIVLIGPLVQLRAWAWALLAACGALVAWLVEAGVAQLPLLAPPMLFTGLLAWWFARSLRAPRQPIITTIVCALEDRLAHLLDPDLLAYTRRLTAVWAGVLALLCVTNAVLAMLAVPNGLLARLGHDSPLALPLEAWSWFANFIDYGLVGGFFLAEYVYRKFRFAERPYPNFGAFLRRMGGLGPEFWQRLFK